MSRKSRITAEEKIQIAQDCIEGRISQSEAARRVEVDESSVRAWIARYEAEGSLGFAKAEKNRVYSEEMKRQAVIEYLAGNESLRKICKKYKIRDSRQLRSWIKVYNSGRDFKKMSGGSRMRDFVILCVAALLSVVCLVQFQWMLPAALTIYDNPLVEGLLLKLSRKLNDSSGKKVYGYLKPELKALVDSIVDELATEDRIKKLYDLWYKQREEVLRSR